MLHNTHVYEIAHEGKMGTHTHSVPHCGSTNPISEYPCLLQILREVGLKHKVDDAETFTACAQRVAANWADAAVSYEPAAAAAAAMKVR